MIDGQVTFGTTGTKNVNFGQTVNEMVFVYDATQSGYADSTHQFNKDGSGKSLVVRVSGNKVLEFSVTGGWGTSTLTFNVTFANSGYPFRVLGQ